MAKSTCSILEILRKIKQIKQNNAQYLYLIIYDTKILTILLTLGKGDAPIGSI